MVPRASGSIPAPCARAERDGARRCARRRTHAARRDPLAAAAARAGVLARSSRAGCSSARRRARTRADHERRAQRLVASLAALGPTFVKMAQLFAGRTDLLAPAYAKRAHDAHRPGAAGAARRDRARHPRGVRRAAGRAVRAVRRGTDRRGVARSGAPRALAGEEVVIKVLRPGVESLVAEDVRVAQRIIARRRALVAESARRRHARRDPGVRRARLRGDGLPPCEAAHAVAIRANFAGSRGMWIPRVMEPMVRQRALVLEYCPGRRVDRLDEWVARGTRAARPPRARGDGAVRADDARARPLPRRSASGQRARRRGRPDHPARLRHGRARAARAAPRSSSPRSSRRSGATRTRSPQSFHALGLVVTGADPAVIRRLAGTLLSVVPIFQSI